MLCKELLLSSADGNAMQGTIENLGDYNVFMQNENTGEIIGIPVGITTHRFLVGEIYWISQYYPYVLPYAPENPMISFVELRGVSITESSTWYHRFKVTGTEKPYIKFKISR